MHHNINKAEVKIALLDHCVMVLYISFILAFQRQALLKNNFVPGFASSALWKQVIAITLPLLSLLLAFYAMAFTPNSLALIIFSTSIMLNPLVSIPLSVAISSVFAGMKDYFIFYNFLRLSCLKFRK